MPLALIKDNTKFDNQKAKVILETKEGVIVLVKDYVVTPAFFGLLSDSVYKDVEYFLFHTEFEILPDPIPIPKDDHPPHGHYDIVGFENQIESYYSQRVKEEYEKQIIEKINKTAIPRFSIPERDYKCPRCNLFTTINQETLQLRCCNLDYETLLLGRSRWDSFL